MEFICPRGSKADADFVRKLISKVRNVLENQLPQSPRRATEPGLPTADKITIRTDARHFESFLRSISRCSSLLDARRLKNDVMGEIRRTRALLGSYTLCMLYDFLLSHGSQSCERRLD